MALFINIVTTGVLQMLISLSLVVSACVISGDLPREQRRVFRWLAVFLYILISLGLLVFGLNQLMELQRTIRFIDRLELFCGILMVVQAVMTLRRHRRSNPRCLGKGIVHPFLAALLRLVPLLFVAPLNAMVTGIGMLRTMAAVFAAVLLAGLVALAMVNPMGNLFERRPTFKTIGLVFLLLIGLGFAAAGVGRPVALDFMYPAILLATGIEALNQRLRFTPRHVHEQWGEQRTEEATVMFIDLRGSTELVISLGGATARELFTDLLTRIILEIERQRGHVERTLGDGIMAVFRTDQPKPHALRCIEAVEEIGETVREVSREWQAKCDAHARLTIGVESGEINGSVIRADGHEEWSSFGPVVNLAARLQAACGPPGLSVLIGPQANRQIMTQREMRCVGDLSLKGFAEAVRVYTIEVAGSVR